MLCVKATANHRLRTADLIHIPLFGLVLIWKQNKITFFFLLSDKSGGTVKLFKTDPGLAINHYFWFRTLIVNNIVTISFLSSFIIKS